MNKNPSKINLIKINQNKHHRCLVLRRMRVIFHQSNICLISRATISKLGVALKIKLIYLSHKSMGFCITIFKLVMTAFRTLFKKWSGTSIVQSRSYESTYLKE